MGLLWFNKTIIKRDGLGGGQTEHVLRWGMDLKRQMAHLNFSVHGISAKHFISQRAHQSHQISVDEQVESVQDQSGFVRCKPNCICSKAGLLSHLDQSFRCTMQRRCNVLRDTECNDI